MTRGKLLQVIDGTRVKEAIEKAEHQTSGEISVSVTRLFWGDVEKAAWKAFHRLGVSRTRDRNGVLIFVVPARRRFVVLGDAGIHEKVGTEFWTSVAGELSRHFRDGRFTDGLVAAVGQIGTQLATHFPYAAATDVNELSNEVDFGPEE
jgi:uncharacterized membrane protein